jgi:hypothetical protein
MVFQLRLFLAILRLRKNSLVLSSYRYAHASGVLGPQFAPQNTGPLSPLSGLFLGASALRAVNLKHYRFGFDSTLFPIKGVSLSVGVLKHLPLPGFFGVPAISAVGA